MKRKLSILIALMMAISVFAIPTMAHAETGEEGQSEIDYYRIRLVNGNSLPNSIAIGQKLDLDVVGYNYDDEAIKVSQSGWTWEIEQYNDETANVASIDSNGILTAKAEGAIEIYAYSNDNYAYSTTICIGFLESTDGIWLYSNKTAKVMDGYVQGDSSIYAVPDKVIVDDWYGIPDGTYTVTALAKDAMLSGTVKAAVVPDSVKSFGAHCLGYDLYTSTSGVKSYQRVSGFKIYGFSENPASAAYARANGFTYVNINKTTVPANVAKVVKPSKVTGLKVKAGKKKMTVRWKRNTKATGYQITYAQNKKFKKGKKNITIAKNKTTKKTIKKLKAKKTYYVKVRAYKKSGSKKLYGAYSKVKKVRVK
ncbi:fibronectin type III domain-containing protein [Zhenpiania hominis]|uniref:Fibronectin type III domain-containing protein n=1 Tax=Zhenpiania hominis TaxID=2763644 RepID=A0A923SXB3_9FIRM|nr:fibronectin type III domain-containing protein [Zhenpiania hominis]MBC6681178.1 fibronectin type III domain-containing protein [Zhenpiania hominis]